MTKESPLPGIVHQIRRVSDNNGFTLVELIVVVAILIVLAAVVIPTYTSNVDKAKNARAIGDLQTIEKDIQAYYIERNAYPPDLNAIGRGGLKDPWGQQYVYAISPTLANALKGSFPFALNPSLDYDLYSKGKSMSSTPAYVAATCEDDIVRASDGSYIGIRNKF